MLQKIKTKKIKTMKSLRVNFNKLIGGYPYSTEEKMEILNWMLKTGKPFKRSTGKWSVEGISQLLFAYSANEYNFEFSIPSKPHHFDDFFDAVFARAVFQEGKMTKWREAESIFPGKYRVIKINDTIPKFDYEKHKMFNWLVSDIFSFDGCFLKKELHHPNHNDRLNPKILWIKIFTIGTGWIVKYSFSFECFNYEPGWEHVWHQKEDQSLWEFLGEVFSDLQDRTITQVLNP